MPREATLFDSADGSVLKGYRLLQRGGVKHSANVDTAGLAVAMPAAQGCGTGASQEKQIGAGHSNWRERVRQD
jgi:hypothetical protein